MSFLKLLRRGAALALCLVMLGGGLAGCSDTDQTFVAAVDGVPDTLDPQLADSEAERIVAVNLFEGLFRLQPDGSAAPAVCESYAVSADGLTWTFALRADAVYNDGDGETPATPVTADDFVFALRRVFAAGSTSPYREAFAGLEGAAAVAAGAEPVTSLGIHAANDRTLIIRLAAPDDGLPQKLCSPGAMPCCQAFYEQTQGTYGLEPETLLANGAFRLSLWSSENGMTLRRIAPGETTVNRVRLVPADPDKSAAQRLADGDTTGEFITGMPSGADTVTFCVQTQTLLINCRDRQLANAGVRAGLAGVLYPALPPLTAEGLSSAGGLVADSVTFDGQSWRQLTGSLLNEALPEDALAAYRQGLAESGRSKLSGITVLVPDTAEWRALYADISLAWQQQLSAFFSVQYLPEVDIAAAVAAGKYQLAFLTHSALQDDVAAELRWYMDATGCANPALTELLTAPAPSADVLQGAERQLLSAWPAVPLATCTTYYALADSCVNVAALPFGPLVDFTNACWVETG